MYYIYTYKMDHMKCICIKCVLSMGKGIYIYKCAYVRSTTCIIYYINI